MPKNVINILFSSLYLFIVLIFYTQDESAAAAAAAAEESQVDEELILSLTQQSQSQWRKSLKHHFISTLAVWMGWGRLLGLCITKSHNLNHATVLLSR